MNKGGKERKEKERKWVDRQTKREKKKEFSHFLSG